MTNIYYVYRYTTDRKWNRYTPSHTLQSAYPEWDWLATIVDERIQTNIPLWKRLGWVECDTSVIWDVATEIKDNGIWAMMKWISNAEALAYMQYYTDYPEVESGKFELTPAGIDDMGEPVEATYLTI